MQRILYKSEADKSTRSEEIFRIVSTSARNNAGRGITGFLIYAQDRFLQLIEGEGLALEMLLSDLQDDPRHHDLTILLREDIAERSLPRWRMERIAVEPHEVEQLIERLRGHGLGEGVCGEIRAFLNPARDAA